MCIIVYKPAGEPAPAKKILEQCFTNNPDGAGLMYSHNSHVEIIKGFMRFSDFYSYTEKIARMVNVKETPIVYHFRIGTQGKNDKANCHPFPVSSQSKDLISTKIRAAVGIAHNGIIQQCSTWSKKETYSDTHYFVRDYASLIINRADYWKCKNAVTLLERIADSKLAILGNDRHVELIGDFVEDNGIYYSNSTYEARKVYKGAYGTLYEWDPRSNVSRPTRTNVFAMPLPDGAYAIASNGEQIELDWENYIDAYHNLYALSWEFDALELIDVGITVRSCTGTQILYNADFAEMLPVIDESDWAGYNDY